MLSSVGMALGPVAGGWIFDTYHDYRWLYLSSTAIALAATAVAFTFPPLPRAQPKAVATCRVTHHHRRRPTSHSVRPGTRPVFEQLPRRLPRAAQARESPTLRPGTHNCRVSRALLAAGSGCAGLLLVQLRRPCTHATSYLCRSRKSRARLTSV